MDELRFDGLTKSLAAGSSRRTVLKGLVAGALGIAAVKRPAAAQTCDPACETGFRCCPGESQDFCVEDSLVCCGVGGTCPAATEVCCGDTNCCPTSGYTCNGASCCETCERFPRQCGAVTAFCGNDPTTLTCGCGSGQICCEGQCVAGNCCGNDDCEAQSVDACGDSVCVENICQAGGCETDEECCNGECCDPGQNCCDSVCQDDPCEPEGCKNDKDCGKDECCCKDGSCSDGCCPDDGDKGGEKPGAPAGDNGGEKPGSPAGDEGDQSVESLPSTGVGSTGDDSWIGPAALLGGAAALLGAKLKQDAKQTDRP